MPTVYVKKEDLSYIQEIPIPLDLDNYFIVEVEAIPYGCIYNEKTGVFSKNINYKVEARSLRDSVRSKIDLFLQPASTIFDELVTDTQKAMLIQDSLLLAKWPTQDGWPYINLPTLSDFCKSIVTIPEWSYPEQSTV